MVDECPSINCDLHPFRYGKNPYRTPNPKLAENLKGKGKAGDGE